LISIQPLSYFTRHTTTNGKLIMRLLHSTTLLSLSLLVTSLTGLNAKLVFEESFDRPDGSKTEDAIGNGWTTNSKSRAMGDKQAFLENGTLTVHISERANHAVSIKHDFALSDCTVVVKFKIGEKDLLKVNFNDPTLKTSHAGHVCSIAVGTTQLQVSDQMNGVMNLALRERKEKGDTGEELKKLIARTEARAKINLKPDSWHELKFYLEGDTVKVFLNDVFQLEHQSPGFGHPTKGNIAFSVPKHAVIDHFQVWDQAGKK
jgi:hypothetical protein